jgi:DNA-binding GntR family transcriptional regulator
LPSIIDINNVAISIEAGGLMAKAARLREVVYSTLKQRIVLNEISPGEPLTELGLARDLECSQGTVREALLRLQEDGLVVRSGHRGTSVTPLDPAEAEEVLDLRKRLETRGALRAVAAYGPDARANLVALRDGMARAARRNDEYALIELDMQFHAAIFALASPPVLEQILIRCMLHSHRQKLWAPGHRRSLARTAERHDVLIAALDAGDGARLAKEIGHHLDTIVEIEAPRARKRRAA